MTLLWEDKKDVYPAKFGELTRLKASNGNVMDGDDKLLGSWVEVQVLSFNYIYVITPGANDAPGDLVRYSYDNETFEESPDESVADYLEELKKSWPNAASKKYGEVVAVLRASERPVSYVGEMVQIQLSPTSLTAFEGHRKQTSFKIAMGQFDPALADLCRFTSEVVTSKSLTWTKLVAKPSQM